MYGLFVRPSNNYAVLDGLRAVSILWVVLSHVIFLGPSGHLEGSELASMYENVGLFYSFWLNGFYGVDCFFVLSGLLISNIIFREIDETGTLNLKVFYIRRILRLSPALIVVVLFVYLKKLPNFEFLWYNVFYINNFLALSDNVMTHTWSLSVEEQFYIAFSAFMFFFRKSRYILMSVMTLIVASFIIRFFIILYLWESIDVQIYEIGDINSDDSTNYIELIYFKPYTRYGAFLFGVLAMYLYRYRYDWLRQNIATWVGKSVVYLALVVIVGVAFSNLYRPQEQPSDLLLFVYHCFIGYLFSAALATLMIALLMRSDDLSIIHRGLSHRTLYPIAQLAYSLYLTHPLVIGMATVPLVSLMSSSIWPGSPDSHVIWPLINLFVTLLIGILVSACIYIFVEKPFMDLRKVILRDSHS